MTAKVIGVHLADSGYEVGLLERSITIGIVRNSDQPTGWRAWSGAVSAFPVEDKWWRY